MTATGNVAEDATGTAKSPFVWRRHLWSQHHEGDQCKSCGVLLTGDNDMNHAHMATRDIWVSNSVQYYIIACHSSPNTSHPRFFLLDLCLTPTCAKWEAHCKPELENTIWGGNLAVPGEGWAERDDVMVTGATRLAYQAANGELSSLAPPIAQAHQDTRFNMISVEVHAGVAVKSGYCFFCLHNESKPFAIRAKPYRHSPRTGTTRCRPSHRFVGVRSSRAPSGVEAEMGRTLQGSG